MATLELQQPFETTEPRLRVENILLPGRHRFRLIVVDNDGIERLVVKPGIALDRLGRIIEVPRDADLSLDRWFAGQSDAHLIGGFKPSLQGVVADVFLHLLPGGPGQGDGYEVKLYLRQEPDPPPLPSPAWPVFTRTDGARRELQDAIFAAWHPKPLPEHAVGQ